MNARSLLQAIQGVRIPPAYLAYRLRRPLTIIVLGMHRSGTSWLTHMISLCGAQVGRNLLGVDVSNQRGHWEDRYGLSVNRHILQHSGGAWDAPPDRLRMDARARWKMMKFLVLRHPGPETTVWKDPRMVLTLPAWKPWIARYAPVAIVRSPLSVARSLHKRDGLPLDRGLRLWQTYNTRLLALAEHEPGMVWVDFDAGRPHFEAQLRTLAGRTGLVVTPSALASYEARLRKSDAEALPDDHALRALYAQLRRKAHP